jgi:hypothetical protein
MKAKRASIGPTYHEHDMLRSKVRLKISARQLQKVPSARTIARLMTTARDHVSKADSITSAAIEAGVPMLVAWQDSDRRLLRDLPAAVSRPQASRFPPRDRDEIAKVS